MNKTSMCQGDYMYSRRGRKKEKKGEKEKNLQNDEVVKGKVEHVLLNFLIFLVQCHLVGSSVRPSASHNI